MSCLDVRNVSKVLGHNRVLDSVSFSVDMGQVVGLEGRNGSGKTMAMRVACGLVRPDEGEALVAGTSLAKGGSFPPSVGLLLEEPALLDGYSGLRNLQLVAAIKGVAQEGDLREAIARVGLDPDDRKRVRTYSLGMRQRLGIAMALMERPDLLVLDEPTNALDEGGRAELARIVREERDRGAAVLLSSHDGEFLRAVCDRVCHMDCGRVTSVEGMRHEPADA